MTKPFFHRNFPLHKSRQILLHANTCYQKQSQILSPQELTQFEEDLESLDQALLAKDRDTADTYARKVDSFTKKRFKKNYAKGAIELVLALAIALAAATVIRQGWFETYEIPTGSMRPTFREQDHLVVSKTTFGINVPFQGGHFYFDPSLVKRGNPIILSGTDLDLPDISARYFWIFPYTKRYIKRLIGKPGDTLYFYGGKIYGVDKEGHEIREFLDNPLLERIEHIPFTSFAGRPSASNRPGQIDLRHMNIPIGRLVVKRDRSLRGEIYDGDSWVKDQPQSAKEHHQEIDTFGDFWGIGNFAMARLLTPDQVDSKENTSKAKLFLELRHTPNLTDPGPRLLVGARGEISLFFQTMTSVIPLEQRHLDRIMENIYTARFVVQNQKATRYQAEGSLTGPSSPKFFGVADGRYEFYHGKGSFVGWGGILWNLEDDHPLLARTPENVQKLFNLGIEFSTLFSPKSGDQTLFPSRFAYFRDGDLYLLGAPILRKDDPVLKDFVMKENDRVAKDSSYIAFKDMGPPLKDDGSLDLPFIQTFGLKIPEGHYFVLGDNHAMSADSRFFGFVPEDNLEGTPSFIFWPPGSRWGFPSQDSYSWFTFANLTLWGIAFILGIGAFIYFRWRKTQPVFQKK